MAVNLEPPNQLLTVPGVRVGVANANIKHALSCADDTQVSDSGDDRCDMALFLFDSDTVVGGVYTQSHFAAAPVQLARSRHSGARGWLINSGNANAATGEPGYQDAIALCNSVAQACDLQADSVLPFSTGVIGERLPVAAMEQGVVDCVATLDNQGWLAGAKAIMTTDTQPKGVSHQVDIDGHPVTLTGIAKGSGMIKPNMATMLAFVACDAQVSEAVAQALVSHSVARSFNRITVDGDTSTNDSFMLACTGKAGHNCIETPQGAPYEALLDAVCKVAQELAQLLVRDGEGATKFVTVDVRGARTEGDALSVAYTIAESPLVKTALFAGDANWGRLCMAIGRAPAEVDPDRVAVWLDDVQVAANGLMADSYSEAAGAAVLAQDEFSISVDLGLGSELATVWTTDLSHEYVRINAEYRT